MELEFFKIEALQSGIKRLLAARPFVCVAIDGRCAAGKTTLAARLSTLYGSAVIHMDHFFLPQTLRTKSRLATPAGNVHYERFLVEAAPSLAKGEPFNYRIFDCMVMKYTGIAKVPRSKLYIVEGAYCMRPELRDLYHLKVFMDISKEEQKRRIKQRNGEDALHDFLSKWLPMEEAYFAAYDVAGYCDFYLSPTQRV